MVLQYNNWAVGIVSAALRLALVTGLLASTINLFAAPGDLRWQINLGSLIYASPTVLPDGTIIVGTDDGTLAALYPDGSERWSTIAFDSFFGTPAYAPITGLVTTNADGTITAYDPETGLTLWEYSTGSGHIASPLIDPSGSVYVGDLDGNFRSLDADGELRWEKTGLGAIDASAAYNPATDEIIVGDSNGVLRAWNSNGTPRWSFTVPGIGDRGISSSPAIDPDGIVYVGSKNGRLMGIDSAQGLFGLQRLIWSLGSSQAIDSSPVIGPDETIYVGSRAGFLYAVNPASEGPELLEEYTLPIGEVFYAAPAIDEAGNAYIVGFLGSNASELVCVSQQGSVRWSVILPGYNDSSAVITPDATLLVGMSDGTLYAFEAEAPPASSSWPMFRSGPDRVGVQEQYTQPLARWESTYFTAEELLDPVIGERNADPDNDGRSNLLEYASGSHPRVADAANPLLPASAADAFTPVFAREPTATDVRLNLVADPALPNGDNGVTAPFSFLFQTAEAALLEAETGSGDSRQTLRVEIEAIE